MSKSWSESICLPHFELRIFLPLHSFYSLLNIIRVIKSRRMRWAGHVARIADRRDAYMVFVGKETTWKTGVDEKIILKWIFKNCDGCDELD